jgi:hypothetical protein
MDNEELDARKWARFENQDPTTKQDLSGVKDETGAKHQIDQSINDEIGQTQCLENYIHLACDYGIARTKNFMRCEIP